MERSDLLLVSLEGEVRWHRDHRLLSRFLRARLEETWPEGIAELHREIADPFRSKGLPEGALQHIAAAGDRKWLLQLSTLAGGDPPQQNLAEALLACGDEAQDDDLLSRRELEVLQLLALGERNKDIARRLGVSLSTVKTHLSHIYQKLEVHNRTQAVSKARRLSLLEAAGTRRSHSNHTLILLLADVGASRDSS